MPHQSPEWTAGWLAGIGFGVLLCVVLNQVDDAFARYEKILLVAAVVTLVAGFMQMKSAFQSSK